MKAFYKFVSTGFGIGYMPFAPGTFGSALACLMVYVYVNLRNPNSYEFNAILIIGSIIFFLIGIKATNYLALEWGKDPSKIVIDEIVGLWIALLFVPFNITTLVLAFVFFRFFDILKPLGIKKLENLDGGLGVMADDVLAGVYANLCLQIGWIIILLY